MNKKAVFIILVITILLLGLGITAANTIDDDTPTVTKTVSTPSTETISKNDNINKISSIQTDKKSDDETNTKNVETKHQNVTKKEKNNNIKNEANNAIITDFNSLNETMTNNQYDEVTISLADNITLEGNISLSSSIKKLNIEGNGKTIDGNNTYVFLKIRSESNVTLTNINFMNCYSSEYGGVIYASQGNLIINNCNFTNNSASSYGGAVYSQNLEMNACNFINNNASGYGGAVYSQNLEMNTCNFVKNNGGRGGAVYSPNVVMNTCNFVNNTGGQGGAVYMTLGRIEDCNFTENSASGGGGAIHSESSAITITVINSNFLRNKVDSSGYGAAINARNLTLINSTLIGNEAKLGIGAIQSSYSTITGCVFKDNYGQSTGAISLGVSLNLTNSTFINNTGTGGNYGPGVIMASAFGFDSTVNLDNNNFINNTGLNGGVIYSQMNVKLNMTNNNFTGNTAEYGGVLYTHRSTTIINSKNNNFTENSAIQGGAIYNTGSPLNTTNDTFTKNNADELGGALLGYANIENASFIENTAYNGGALSLISPTKLNNSIFIENHAISGGAIDAIDNINIPNSVFINNTATNNGGAIFGRPNVEVTVKNSSFTQNNVLGYGGAVYGTKLVLEDNNFTDNHAGENGGAVHGVADSIITSTNNNFTNNSAKHYGGAVNGATQSIINIANSTFTQNTAGHGGAVNSAQGSIATINNTTFTENNADYGGATHINGSADITNTIFNNNTANESGSIIYCVSDSARILITDSNVTDNYVNNNEGYVVDVEEAGSIIIKDNYFKNNTDNTRDMLFSPAKNARLDITENEFEGNYLSIIMTPLDDVNVTDKNDTVLNYSVSVSLREIYNYTIDNGWITYTYHNITKTVEVKNGTAMIEIANKDLTQPINLVNYTYIPDQNNYQTVNHDFNIHKLVPTFLTITLNPENKVNVGETVTVTVTLEDTDGKRLEGHEIEIEINGQPYDLQGNNKTDINGEIVFSYPVTNFRVNDIDGEIVFTAKHLETHNDSIYDSSDNVEKTIIIGEIPTHIHIDYNPADARETNTFNATITLCSDEESHEHIINEEINYRITNINKTLVIQEGTFNSTHDGYNITINNLPEEGVIVSAWFNGSRKYDPSMEEEEIIPDYIGTQVEIIIPVDDVFINQTETITIKLENTQEGPLADDHVVTVIINGDEEILVPIIGGEGTLNYTSNISTQVNITAVFDRTSMYSGSRGSASYHVRELPTHTILELTNNKVGNTTIKATVNDTRNNKPVNGGNITLTLPDGTNLTENIIDSMAIFHITTLNEGEYDLEARFNGVPLVYIPSDQNTHRIEIVKTETNITLENITVMVTDENITVNVEVTDEYGQNVPEGNVKLIIGDLEYQGNLTDGKSSIPIDNLPSGEHIITAMFTGDDTYKTSNTTATLTVNLVPTKASAEILDTTLSNTTIKVTVTNLTGDKVSKGNITIEDEYGNIDPLHEEIVLINGEATVTIPTTVTGLIKIRVQYNENDIYASCEATDENNNTPIQILVTKIPTITKVEILNTTLNNVTIRVTVTNKTGHLVHEGEVLVKNENGRIVNNSYVKEGVVEFNIPADSVGPIKIEVKYQGTDKYLESYARNETSPTGDPDENKTIIDVKAIPTTITGKANNGTNTQTSVDVTLTDNEGNPLPNANIALTTIDDEPLTTGTTNNNGEVNIPVTLPVGNMTLKIIFEGNETHLASNTTASITTQKHNTTITPTDNENRTITINITDEDDNPIPRIPVIITDENGNIIGNGTTDENGTTNITIPLPPGDYNITITTPGDENNTETNQTIPITIPKIPTKITATTNNGTNTQTSIDIELTDEEGNPIPEAPITITDKDGNQVGEGTTDKDGKTNIPLTLPTGEQNITITYPGNTTYKPSNTTTPITTQKHNTTITPTDNENGTITINITDEEDNPVPGIPVIITDENGNIIGNGTTNENGTVDIPLNTTPGDHNITITTPEDENNTGTNTTIPVTIPPKPTDMEIKINNGTQPTAEVKLTDEDGKPISGAPITIKDKDGKPIGNGTTDKDGKAIIPLDIPTGTNNITVTYPGNTTYKPSNKTVPATKDKHTPKIDVVVDPNGTAKVNITDETGKPIPGLPVNITDKTGKVIGNGTTGPDGTVTIPTQLEPGNHNITVTTPEDKDNKAANKTVPVVIPPKDTKMNVTVTDPIKGNTTVKVTLKDEDNKAVPNAPITVTLPNGTKIPATTGSDGTANVPLDMPVGNYNIKVDYPGNSTYKASTQTIPVNVQKIPTTTTITANNNTAGNVRVTGTVKDKYNKNVNEGTVTIKTGNTIIGTGTLSNGAYNILTNINSKGSYPLTAQYAGTNTYLPSNSTTITVNVNAKTPTMTTKTEGDKVGNTSITATLKDPNGQPIPNALVRVTLPNGTNITGTTNSSGVAKIPVDLREGNNNLTITYLGNGTYNPVTVKETMKVTKNMPVIKLNPVRGIIGEDITLTAYLTDADGTPITGGNLAFKLNGKTLRNDGRFDSNAPAMKFSVKDGLVTYTIKADLYLRNAKNLTAAYSGNYKYEEVGSETVEAQIQKRYANVTVTATPTKNKQYETITFKATVKDTTRNGKNTTLISQDTYIMFKVNGNTLKNSKGEIIYVPVGKDLTASYTYTIPAGTGGITASKAVRDYKVDALFTGINYYPGARNSTKFNVERSPVTVNITSASVTGSNVLSVKATIKDYKGNNVIGTNKYTIKINGKSYTDKNGKPIYWSAKNGAIDLRNIQVDPKTTVKRVMIVTGERQAYLEGRTETTTILRT